MFREFVVLFVGYRHSDAVMKYLGLGLGPSSKRYVLTDEPEDANWKRLHITPLEYPYRRYDLLTRCLSDWADLGEMGLLDHRQRIRGLVSSPSEPTPEEMSYLEDSIRRPDRVGFFCDYASDRFWLDWASGREPFKAIFDRASAPSPVSDRFALWFAERFALVDDAVRDGAVVDAADRVSVRAWTVFGNAGGVLGTAAWNAIARELFIAQHEPAAHTKRWLWLLMEQEHAGTDPHYLDYALGWTDLDGDPSLGLALIAHHMSPRLTPDHAWGSSRMQVQTRGHLYWLKQVWAEKCVPALPRHAAQLLSIADAALLKHLNLEAQVTNYSAINHRRSAIQDHVQDRHTREIDIVIQAVRDSAMALWATEPTYVRRMITTWLSSEHALMRRIAVHVAGEAPGATADNHLQFLLDNRLESDQDVAQEVLHLLGRVAAEADTSLIDQLVRRWTPPTSDDRDLYRAFSRFAVLAVAGVDHLGMRDQLADIRSRLPADLEPSPYPGMRSWIDVGTESGVAPMTDEEFVQLATESPETARDLILGFEDRTFPRAGQTSREDALGMLRSAVAAQPAVGFALWPHISQHPDLKTTVVSAWGHAKTEADARAIVELLSTTDLKPILHGIGQFLIHADSRDGARWEQFPATDDFIENAWAACVTDEIYAGSARDGWDWVSETINSTAGQLLDFWFELFRRRRAAAGDAWSGLSDSDRAFLDQALADRTKRGAMALTQMAGRLHFLDAADSAWCRACLLPKRDWSAPTDAEPFWWGVLSFARWNGGLAASGLLDGLIETAGHLSRFRDEQTHRWAQLLASIAIQCDDPATSTWIDTFTARATGEWRQRWLQAIAAGFEDMDNTVLSSAWAGWLHEYWQRRAVGVPMPLSSGEENALAVAAAYLKSGDFREAVALVESTSAGFDAHADAARLLPDDLIDAQPTYVARYLTHLMNHTVSGSDRFWGHHSLVPKLRRIVATPGDWTALREAALGLGIDP